MLVIEKIVCVGVCVCVLIHVFNIDNIGLHLFQ